MEYFIFFVIVYLIITPSEISSITTRVDQPGRNFRRHTGPPPFPDWELGLREAVHQALLREHHTDPTLREQLLAAPFLGRQNNVSPFGDIAVLARGQLYITSGGFKFLQDSDQDDCTNCHTPRCVQSQQCQLWAALGHHHKLLALWTVKRIRHRDPHYGHIYEIEYTISPITSVISEELVRRHGYFDYNVPGHIFVIKSNPRTNPANYLNGNGDKWYKNQPQEDADRNQGFKSHGSGHFKPGILIGVSPDGYKHVLHSFPGFYSSYHPQTPYDDHTTIDPKEYELYKKLIESLASKTSNVPHRFSVTPSDKTTTRPTYVTTFVPQTTFLQVTDGHFIPIPENTLPATTVKFPTTLRPTEVTKFSQPDVFYQTPKPKPVTMPVTTIHYFTPVQEIPTKISTATTSKKVISTTSKPKVTTEPFTDHFDIFTTTPVKKTTRFVPLEKTTQPVTTQVEQVDVFPVTSTEPMQPVTEVPKQTSPDSVNEQLPPPDKEFETTVPYVLSTVTQPSTLKTETTRKITTLVPSTREEMTTIEKIPYTEERTTVIFPVSQKERTTTAVQQDRSTTVTDNVYTIAATVPLTTGKSAESTVLTERVPITILNPSTTQAFTVVAQSLPTLPVTQSTTNAKPTTIFEYSFDTTTKPYTTLPSTINTLPGTTSHLPSTQTTKFSVPTTTIHYYTFDTDVPKTSTISTQGTTFTTQIATTSMKKEVSTQSITEPTTEKSKISVSSASNDFLVDSNEEKRKKTDSRKDFSEDDIFGTAVPATTQMPETTTVRRIQTDIEKALFGGRRTKQIKVSSKVTRRPVVNTTKIIYNNFFAPSTRNPTTPYTLYDTTSTTEFRPSTDQSYSTSISFEVNKRKSTKPTLVLESTVKADLTEVPNNGSYKIYKAEYPKGTTEKSKSETKKALDNAALQLVNHARSIDYLNRKVSRQPKYRKRGSYSTRRKSVRRSGKSGANVGT